MNYQQQDAKNNAEL